MQAARWSQYGAFTKMSHEISKEELEEAAWKHLG